MARVNPRVKELEQEVAELKKANIQLREEYQVAWDKKSEEAYNKLKLLP